MLFYLRSAQQSILNIFWNSFYVWASNVYLLHLSETLLENMLHSKDTLTFWQGYSQFQKYQTFTSTTKNSSMAIMYLQRFLHFQVYNKTINSLFSTKGRMRECVCIKKQRERERRDSFLDGHSTFIQNRFCFWKVWERLIAQGSI